MMPKAARRRSPAGLVLAVLVALAVLFGAAPARADDADTKAAKKHFGRGEKLFNLGNFKEAIFGYRNYLRQVPDADNREAVLALIDDLEDQQREREATAVRERALHEPPPPPHREPRPPVYKRGWFWGGVAALAVITVGIVVVTRGDGAPTTDLGTIVFD